ncbi:unnamed protein product, partial [marine sediment metagenome]
YQIIFANDYFTIYSILDTFFVVCEKNTIIFTKKEGLFK